MLKDKNKFWATAIVTLLALMLTTTLADIWGITASSRISVHDDEPSRFLDLLIIPSLPGYLFYILATGDIHGWRPGPIGQVGRIVVIALGSWIFWTPLIYWIYKRRLKKKSID